MKKGFTLIELVVVIALISTLSVTLAPKVLSQINKSKVSKVTQELADLRRDVRIIEIETNEDIESVEDLNNFLKSDYTTLEAAVIPESDQFHSSRNNEGGWVLYDGELYANLPNGAYTGNEMYEIWEVKNNEGFTNEFQNILLRNVKKVQTSERDDTINVNDDFEKATLDTGDGNDTVIVKDDFQFGAVLETGAGDDVVEIGNSLGDDQGKYQGGGTISTGEGNDTISIGAGIKKGSEVNAGSGNDTIVVTGHLKDTSTIKGGEGYDTLNFTGVNSATWTKMVEDGRAGQITGVEKITLSDGTIIYP